MGMSAGAPQEECSTPTLSVFLLVTRQESPISNRRAFGSTFYCYIGTTGWGGYKSCFSSVSWLERQGEEALSVDLLADEALCSVKLAEGITW